MDSLDLILLEAWNRISKEVRAERIEALRRSQRRFTGILTRPVREWCLVIRASDTRINRWFGATFDEVAVAHREPHEVTIPGEVIRRLTKPINIDWPGVTYDVAARICGREYNTVRGWVRKGMFQIDRYRGFGFPELPHREPIDPATGKQRRGRGGRPYVWTPSPVDPNNFTGRPPHPAWGTLWQHLWENIPDDYEIVAQRVPVFKCGRGRKKYEPFFHGWDFLCPGKMNIDGSYQGCGRRAKYLYGPQTVWTLAKAIEGDSFEGFAMPEGSGLAGEWFPGMSDTVAAPGTRSFACKKCWHVRTCSWANETGWNEFISVISGGLLYGHEVPRPLELCPIQRKSRPYKKYTWSEERRARWMRKRKMFGGHEEGDGDGVAAAG
jgi:hypothetical protein